MACESCIQKIKEDDGTKDKAQMAANEEQEWVGIYNEEGSIRYCIGAECVGKPVIKWYTPDKNV